MKKKKQKRINKTKKWRNKNSNKVFVLLKNELIKMKEKKENKTKTKVIRKKNYLLKMLKQ